MGTDPGDPAAVVRSLLRLLERGDTQRDLSNPNPNPNPSPNPNPNPNPSTNPNPNPNPNQDAAERGDKQRDDTRDAASGGDKQRDEELCAALLSQWRRSLWRKGSSTAGGLHLVDDALLLRPALTLTLWP